MDYRSIESEHSSNGRCCHLITQSGLCLNSSYLVSGWHAIRSKRGQGRQSQEAVALHRGQKKSGGEKDGTAAAAAKSLQLCPTLCDPIDGSPPGSTVPGILQARTLEWVAIYFLLQCMKVKSESEVTQLCPTLSDPMDCSLPGSSIHGIFQARVLE